MPVLLEAALEGVGIRQSLLLHGLAFDDMGIVLPGYNMSNSTRARI
jgi:hypothetical protein